MEQLLEQPITVEVIPTFECRDCNLKFDCKEDFSSHVEGIHNDSFLVKQKSANKSSVECPQCLVKFTQKNNLMRHIRRFHESSSSSTPKIKPTLNESQECPECCIKFTRRSNLIRHFRRFHKALVPSTLPQKPKIFACPECDTKFTKLSNARRHIRNFHLLKRELEQIQYSVETSNSLENETSCHASSINIDFKSECPLEDDSLFDKNKSDEDFNSHCRLSDDSLSDKIKLENFEIDYSCISTDSVEIKHECIACNLQLNGKEELINHFRDYHVDSLNENNSVGKFVCSDCNKFYSTPFNLKRHIKHTHSEKVTNVVSDQNNSGVSELKSCPLCEYSDNKLNLYVHFTSAHNIPMVIECHEFETLHKFEEWRARLEEETQCAFVRISKTISTEISRMVLACSHSRTKSKDKGDFGFCPAEITLIVDNEKCTVYFVKGHVGHGTNENDCTDVEITELGLNSITVVDGSS